MTRLGSQPWCALAAVSILLLGCSDDDAEPSTPGDASTQNGDAPTEPPAVRPDVASPSTWDDAKAWTHLGYDARNHYHHFVDACLGGAKTDCHFGQSGPMTEAILLGTVAVRIPEVELAWDSKSLRLAGDSTANRLLRRTYRAGWRIG